MRGRKIGECLGEFAGYMRQQNTGTMMMTCSAPKRHCPAQGRDDWMPLKVEVCQWKLHIIFICRLIKLGVAWLIFTQLKLRT